MSDDLVTALFGLSGFLKRHDHPRGESYVRQAADRITEQQAHLTQMEEALRDISSIDRLFIEANGTERAIERIIARANEGLAALSQDYQPHQDKGLCPVCDDEGVVELREGHFRRCDCQEQANQEKRIRPAPERHQGFPHDIGRGCVQSPEGSL